MLRTLSRLIIVILALILAAISALASFAYMMVLFSKNSGEGQLDKLLNLEGLETLLDYTVFMTGTGGIILIVPAILLALIGETVRIRSWLYYIIGGGLAIVVIPFMMQAELTQADIKTFSQASGRYLSILLTSGFVMGFVYWLIAGRKA